MLLHFWTRAEQFADHAEGVRAILGRYPQDAQVLLLRMSGMHEGPEESPGYRWVTFEAPAAAEGLGIDSRAPIEDWSRLDEVLADFPDPRSLAILADNQPADGRYRLAGWMSCLFERHWSLREMTNALMDFSANPREVHRLYRALTDFSLAIIGQARDELGADDILTTDDFGMQTGPFFRPEVFLEFFAPYYGQLFCKTHELGMHFWLHSCGNIEPFLPALINLGLDVIHPIQKYAMDERLIAERYGGGICV